MEVETTPAMLDAAEKHGARVKYTPNIDLGQLLSLVPLLVLAIAGMTAFFDQKSKNEIQDERIAANQKSGEISKAEISKSLADITGEVKAVNTAVQTLSLQVQLAQQAKKP